jgi:cell wall-associated NlpC family hydrolase
MSLQSTNFRSTAGWIFGCLMSVWLAWAGPADIELEWPADLAASRKKVLTKGLELMRLHPEIPYREGGADQAGMDCSGAIVWLLGQADVEVPRTAHGQYEWMQKAGRLTVVPATARQSDSPVFKALLPGDLIFWAADGEGSGKLRVSHVHMFLGREKDGHAVMIGSSDGRGYRGKRMSGFGIVDFQVPKEGQERRIVGYGSPFPAAEGK